MKSKKRNQKSGGETERLQSLDALRGFDMFWITGGATIISALATWSGADWLQAVNRQFQHVEWVGFRFEDLIFPLFMFISGVAIPFALIAKRERGVPRSSPVSYTHLDVYKRQRTSLTPFRPLAKFGCRCTATWHTVRRPYSISPTGTREILRYGIFMIRPLTSMGHVAWYMTV